MPGKEMEGDNRFRRKMARQSHKHGKEPSEEGVTLGASKQRRHLRDDEEHAKKVEIHRVKQHLPSKDRPEPRPGSRGRRTR